VCKEWWSSSINIHLSTQHGNLNVEPVTSSCNVVSDMGGSGFEPQTPTHEERALTHGHRGSIFLD